jgi:hypothetical protein
VLVQELLGFEVRITSAGDDTYGAWHAGANDDLVLAVALACWWGEHAPGRVKAWHDYHKWWYKRSERVT